MAERRTTRCCSATALIAALTLFVRAGEAKKNDTGPPAFWPVRPVWTLALNNQLAVAPAYDAANGYFPIEGHRLAAYELNSGTQLWIVDAAPEGAVAAGGGHVFFVQDGLLTALDATDGSPAWTSPVEPPLAVPPMWDTGWLMLATKDGAIDARRAGDGVSIWRRAIGAAAHARLAVSGDRVYVPATDNRVVALRIETGEPIWERRLGGSPNEILALEDRVFVGCTDNYFYSIDAADGRVDWRWRAGADAIGLPVVDEHHVYFVALDNVLRALNRSNGVQQWIQLLKLRPMAGPVKAGATVIVYGLQPPLRAFDAADGKALGDIAAPGPLAAPPHLTAVGDGTPALVVVTRDIAKGDTVTLIARGVEPQATPLAPLLNPVMTVPAWPTPGSGAPP